MEIQITNTIKRLLESKLREDVAFGIHLFFHLNDSPEFYKRVSNLSSGDKLLGNISFHNSYAVAYKSYRFVLSFSRNGIIRFDPFILDKDILYEYK